MRRPTLHLTWSEDMSVGIPEVDEDHKRFFDLINMLNRSITTGKESSLIMKTLQCIIDDAVSHFAHEEKLFREWHYPEADAHAKKHANVVKALEVLQHKFVPYSKDSEWMDAGIKVKKILLEHIVKEDMKYADYYRENSGLLNADIIDQPSETRQTAPNHFYGNEIEPQTEDVISGKSDYTKAIEIEVQHFRTQMEKLVQQRTERLKIRNEILEASNANLSEQYQKMSQKYYAYLANFPSKGKL
jgi:hemerythrin-like metal-binding protein